jgi:intein-encoded DNA endonuclease-like protein
VRIARQLREGGMTYRAIANQVQQETGAAVSWRAVSDWCSFATRVSS